MEEDLGAKLVPAAGFGLLEDGLEVVLHGPRRDEQLGGDGGGVVPAGHQGGHVALPGGQSERLEPQWRDVLRGGLLKHNRYPARSASIGQRCVQGDPPGRCRDVDRGGCLSELPTTSCLAGQREDRNRHRAGDVLHCEHRLEQRRGRRRDHFDCVVDVEHEHAGRPFRVRSAGSIEAERVAKRFGDRSGESGHELGLVRR